MYNKRLRYRRGTVHQWHIILEVKYMIELAAGEQVHRFLNICLYKLP